MTKTKQIKNLYKDISTDINDRWENGIDHHPKSIELYEHIAALDFEFGNDFFCFKSGGDGDNGEHLMYLLDMYFERQDKSGNLRTCEYLYRCKLCDGNIKVNEKYYDGGFEKRVHQKCIDVVKGYK